MSAEHSTTDVLGGRRADYRYRAYTPQGDLVRGKIRARDEAEAFSLLEGKNLLADTNSIRRTREEASFFRSKKIKGDELIEIFQQLKVLYDAGRSLPESLRTVLNGFGPKDSLAKATVSDLYSKVLSGSDLSSALEGHEEAVGTEVVGILRSSERIGDLGRGYETAVRKVEESRDMGGKVIGALLYIGALYSAAIGVSFFISREAIARTAEALLESNLDPHPYSLMYVNFWSSPFAVVLFVVLPIVSIITFFILNRNASTRARTHVFLLRVPIFGKYLRYAAVTRFFSTYNIGLEAGLRHIDIIDMCLKSETNIKFREILLKIKENIKEGAPLEEPIMNDAVFFPEYSKSLFATGAETGKLAENTRLLADSIGKKTEALANGMIKSINPIFIPFVGLFLVAAIAANMLLVTSVQLA